MPSRREVWANATTGSAMRTSAERTTRSEIQRDDIVTSLLGQEGKQRNPRCRKFKPIDWLVHHNAVFAGAHLLSEAVFELLRSSNPILPWTGTRKSQDHTSRKCE